MRTVSIVLCHTSPHQLSSPRNIVAPLWPLMRMGMSETTVMMAVSMRVRMTQTSLCRTTHHCRRLVSLLDARRGRSQIDGRASPRACIASRHITWRWTQSSRLFPDRRREIGRRLRPERYVLAKPASVPMRHLWLDKAYTWSLSVDADSSERAEEAT